MSRALVAAAAMPPKKKGKRGLPPGALYHTERKYFKLLFCGKEFPAGAEETRRALEKEEAVGNCEFRFVQCAREDVARGAHVGRESGVLCPCRSGLRSGRDQGRERLARGSS